jgi:uncharacterized protein (DUF1697 family)
VNVGGHNRIRMAELSSLLTELGCSDVRTLLQSGNAVFSSETAGWEAKIESAIEDRFGFRPDVHVRAIGELQSIIDSNPFVDEALEHPSHLVVYFHRQQPDAVEAREVQSRLVGPERIGFSHGHLIVDFSAGIGTSMADRTRGWKRLVNSGTGRNWSTVLKLSQMI